MSRCFLISVHLFRHRPEKTPRQSSILDRFYTDINRVLLSKSKKTQGTTCSPHLDRLVPCLLVIPDFRAIFLPTLSKNPENMHLFRPFLDAPVRCFRKFINFLRDHCEKTPRQSSVLDRFWLPTTGCLFGQHCTEFLLNFQRKKKKILILGDRETHEQLNLQN
jgi:hypothetical protein